MVLAILGLGFNSPRLHQISKSNSFIAPIFHCIFTRCTISTPPKNSIKYWHKQTVRFRNFINSFALIFHVFSFTVPLVQLIQATQNLSTT